MKCLALRFARLLARSSPPAFLFAASLAQAEMRTLTDTQGRTIEADVIAVNDTQAKIRRADGQVFDLPLDRLAEADRKALTAWAKQQESKPRPLAPGTLEVQMSRGKFSSETVETDVTLTSGATVKNGRVTTEEKWGYSFLLNNRGSAPLTELRAEYILYATVDNVHKEGKKEGLREARHQSKIEDVPAFGRVDFRTETVSVFKMKYKGNIVSAATGDRKSRETLHGIWIRIYLGDELLHEAASPESLKREGGW